MDGIGIGIGIYLHEFPNSYRQEGGIYGFVELMRQMNWAMNDVKAGGEWQWNPRKSSFTLASNTADKKVNKKVKLDLYYETLCPGCSKFMTYDLMEIFANGLINIIDLHFVPYGNAELGGQNNTTVYCQHGNNECELNMVHACAIYAWPYVNKHFDFLHCIEHLVVQNNYEMPEWESCFGETGFDSTPVMDCKNGPKGLELILRYANETNSLKPPHEFVPWVVVDGKPLREHGDEFMTYVCKAYKGKHLPRACKNLNDQIVSEVKENKICHVKEPAKLSSAPKMSPVA
ncbi:Gamma-interferon-responsive lysosomal thiol protein [Thalictrum thalictroides]|uniref:Gamma-interferon-responsive lysosomal thiol protein n=1 Tax=Thalictrum thalictroides TaxID=46969 RepID=A0A7J6VBR8_THATH|nr:Gamma-interferon-responsive lysosomal thiol protein [Thalictrum thalictroides]